MPQHSFEHRQQDTSGPAHRADIAHCRALLRDGSRTFYAASFLLPRWLREPASALYAFCRQADDIVDIAGGRLNAIAALQQRLDDAYRGAPASHPIDRAFAATVNAYAIPRQLPEALLDGLNWDATGQRYEDLPALNAYAARVAGSVGAMMAILMGVRSARLLEQACDLGIAMQMTNIARDVGEDARNGRIYLPLSWMREAGLQPEAWLARPTGGPALVSVIERLLDCADVYYARADAGIAMLPASCRPGIRAARLLYAEIGHQLRREGCDSVSRRTIVPPQRKLGLLVQALASPDHAPSAQRDPRVHAAQFLVECVPAALDGGTRSSRSWWNIHGHAVWLIQLIERLERQDHEQRQRYPARIDTRSLEKVLT